MLYFVEQPQPESTDKKMKRDCRNCTAPSLGEKITVASKKGCVFLDSLGSAPFAVVETKRGPAVVPSGYKATSYSDGEFWHGETSVVFEGDEPVIYYRFTSDRNPDVSSEWKLTPTEAYKECNDRLHTGFSGASNGQLIIGVTYPSLQERIFAAMPEALQLLNQTIAAKSNSRSCRKRPTAAITPRRSKRATSFASSSSSNISSSEDEDDLSYGPNDTEVSDTHSESETGVCCQNNCSEEEQKDEDLDIPMDEDLQMIELNRCFSLQTVSARISTPMLNDDDDLLTVGVEGFADFESVVVENQTGVELTFVSNGNAILGGQEELVDFLSSVPLEGN